MPMVVVLPAPLPPSSAVTLRPLDLKGDVVHRPRGLVDLDELIDVDGRVRCGVVHGVKLQSLKRLIECDNNRETHSRSKNGVASLAYVGRKRSSYVNMAAAKGQI